jgi:Trk K+ transport system NAD-binding subunit
VTNAEIRGTAEDVVTLTMDERDAAAFDTERRYRLVTLPVEARTDREFAAQLRAAEETTTAVTIEADSPLASGSVGALDIAVVAIRTEAGDIEAIPSRTRALSPGETVFVIARPDQLRKLESAAAGPAER